MVATVIDFMFANAQWIATLIAILVGPIAAVFVTRSLDERRAKRERQYKILSELMRTRRARLDPEHVSALNLVELEFYGHNQIRASFKNYVRHLNSVWPTDPEEISRHSEEGADLFSEFLKDVANSMGYKFDKRDLERLGYLPRALGNQHDNQFANSQYLREVFEGRRSIPIVNFIKNDAIYPPPPAQQITDQSEKDVTLDTAQSSRSKDES